MKQRILIVEDESLIAHSLAYAFRREAFDVATVATGSAALETAAEWQPDLVVLDLILPGAISGMDVCRMLRERSSVPIIVLTARSGEMDRVLALERGADDYVLKPFSMPELIGRVRAHLRRRELDRGEAAPTRRIADLEIDLARREVRVAGEAVHLTASEFDLLAFLSERPGVVYERHDIVVKLWGSDYVGDMRSCDAHVARVRRKIERDPHRPERLVSVRGVGYKLEPR